MAKTEYTADDLKADLQNSADEARIAARRAADQAAAKGEELAGKAQAFAQTAREKAGEAAETARDLGREYADVARDEAKRLYQEGERAAAEMAGAAEGYYDDLSEMVRRNPVQALGIAAGVGFLVGLLIARR